jgi:hypothetical protein
MRRTIPLAMLILVMLGCEFKIGGSHDQKFGVRFDTEYFEKEKICAEKPARDPIDLPSMDYGEQVHSFDRTVEWYSKAKFLGDTCYKASIGPFVYQDDPNSDPIIYAIDIEARVESQYSASGYSWDVLFERMIPIDELPEGFLYKDVHDVVSFDPISYSAVFSIGQREYVYVLPQP